MIGAESTPQVRIKDPREAWIRMLKLLDRFEKQLDEEYAVLESRDIRRLKQLRIRGNRMLEEIGGLKGSGIKVLLAEPELRSFSEILQQKEKRVRGKILRNVHRAEGIRAEAQGRICAIRTGKRKVVRGYFGGAASLQGYFIDRQIGCLYK